MIESIKKVAGMVSAFKSDTEKLAKEHARLMAERERILATCPTKEDFIAHVRACTALPVLDVAAAAAASLASFYEFPDDTAAHTPDPWKVATIRPAWENRRLGNENDAVRLILELFREDLGERLAKRLESMPWPENTMPVKERRAALAKVDAAIEAIEAQRTEIIELAAAVSNSIDKTATRSAQ